MLKIFNRYSVLVLLCISFILPGCADINTMARRTAQDVKLKDARRLPLPTPGSEAFLDSSCPSIEVVADLGSSMEFTNMSYPKASEMLSRLDVSNVSHVCKFSGNSMTLDLNIDFKGRLGPKAKHSGGGHPFASYPFFVALLSPQNHILAKEVFSASLTYNEGEAVHAYRETIRQVVPLPDKESAPYYRVLIGFQLSPEQLAYNRALIKQASE